MQLAVEGHVCELAGGVTGDGPVSADLMLIGIAPGKHEWLTSKRPMTGPSGKELDNFLKFINLRRSQVFVSNLLCWWNDKPNPEEIKQCLPRLMDEIYAVKPKLIVLLGAIATDFFLGQQMMEKYETVDNKGKPKAPSFGTMQGGVFKAHIGDWEGLVLPTFHPAAYLHQSKSFALDVADAVRDFRKIKEILDGTYDDAEPTYEVAQSSGDVESYLWHTAIAHTSGDVLTDLVAVDVETEYDGSDFISIAFACEHQTLHVPRAMIRDVNWSALKGVQARWTFHNGQFDRNQIKKWLDVDLRIREDTMLMSYSLDERGGQGDEVDAGGATRAVGIHGLKGLAREYCASGFYDAKAKGRINKLEPDELAYYNALDAHYTLRLARRFIPLQIDDDVRDIYLDFMVETANTLSEITEYGVRIDRKALRDLALEWIPQWEEALERLQDEANKFGWDAKIRNKAGNLVPADERINLASWQQLQHFIYDICKVKEIRGEGRTTKMDVLKQFAADLSNPLAAWCNELLAWRGLDHDLSNYVQAIDEDMDEHGIIHPECLIHGTRVGRFSYRNPPIQTIPKQRTVGANRARIRRIFRARKGMVFLEADYSQAELYAAAMASGDGAILADLRSGDFHAANIPLAFHVTREELIDKHGYVDGMAEFERLRDSTKIYTYGKLYGGGVGALTGENRVGRGSGGNYAFMDHKTAVELEKAWEARYHVYMAFREAEKRIVMNEGEQVNWNGRKRRYFRVTSYKQLNQAINFPCSSLSHDHLIDSMNKLHNSGVMAEYNAHVLFDVHDSLLIECPKEYVEEVARIVKRTMEAPKFGLPFGIPVDVKVGRNWFDMEKMVVTA
jgi:uracil-DNA glycosylase family 4